MQKFLQNSLFKLLKAKQKAEDAHIKTALSEAPGPANTSNPSSIPTTTKVSSSPVVIRVRGLPLDRQTAKALTEEAITTNLTESTNFRITIIPSCIFSDETVALVDFECLPKFLSSLEINHLDSWETSVHGTDLSFDKHFIGFTQLSDPEGEVQADVITLCGIDGHAYGSWQGRGNLRKMWLRHFLPEDLPSCRIISYGYKAKLARRDFATIEAYADEFMEALSTIKKPKTHTRPMIFITHSFGGLVLARSIIKAKQIDIEPACSAIRGILFFAVPHRGIDISDMSRIMDSDRHPRLDLIEHIGIDSLALKAQLKDFVSMLRDVKIVSFYETEQSRRLVRDGAGDWKRNGEYFTSLEASNAVLELPHHIETQIPLHEDHSSIVKFRSKSDSGYQYALAHLRQMVERLGNTFPLGSISNAHTISSLARKASPTHYVYPPVPNHRFVGRNSELSRLEKWLLDDSCQRLAIVGLGGVGKTQLARAFCHNTKHKYPKYSIFWVSALSWTRFQQDFSKLCQCGSTLSYAEKENALLLAKEYLQSEASGDWLLVVDNADDTDLFQNSKDSITSCMPNNERGKILFTTRHKDAVVDVAEWNVLQLMEMSMEEAGLFLEKILGQQAVLQDETATTELLKELTCLPLAIVQASSYMVKKSVSIPRYLAIMRSTDDAVVKLLSSDFKDNTRDETSSNALATTWLVSFKQIQRDNPHAADMLFCAALLENRTIPLALLPPVESNVDLANTIGTLLGYSFFTEHEKEGFYNMHRLVHHAIKICMPHNDRIKQQTEALIDRLASVFPIDDWENRSLWHAYLPHAVRVLQDTKNVPSERRADLCESVAICLWRDGIYPEAITWISECSSWRHQWLSEIDTKRLRAQQHLAGIHLDNGDVKQAIDLLEYVVKIKKSRLAEDDLDLLGSICEQARSYRSAGEFKKGIKLLEHVHQIEQKFHAEDYPQILVSQLGLGSLYLDDGQIEKAIEMLENADRMGAKVWDEDHPLRLSSQHELARAYLENSETDRAIELYQHVVQVRENVLVAEHPKLLATQHELARAYLEVSETKRAIGMFEHVVRVQNKALLEDHPGRLRSEHCLGVAYLDNGQSSRAISLLEHVVKTQQNTLPADHFQRLFSEQELARAYYEANQLDRAIDLMEAVVAQHRLNLAIDDSIRLSAEAWLPVMHDARKKKKGEKSCNV